ncbi:MAG: hypothetical protein M3R55_13580 [Acidobacteriota bacterium]|nr:hypothetical protein [Acidobacteriota bacterium]
MGLIWDIIQHGQIADSQKRAASLEERVEQLERELRRTNEALVTLLRGLEQRFGQDLDGDNRVG